MQEDKKINDWRQGKSPRNALFVCKNGHAVAAGKHPSHRPAVCHQLDIFAYYPHPAKVKQGNAGLSGGDDRVGGDCASLDLWSRKGC
jgi:hypothetical protein